VKRRGLTDEDIKLVQVDPFSAGNFGFPLEEGKRVVRAVSYYRGALTDNAYSHPIEGVGRGGGPDRQAGAAVGGR